MDLGSFDALGCQIDRQGSLTRPVPLDIAALRDGLVKNVNIDPV
jgi:hypothetical protein